MTIRIYLRASTSDQDAERAKEYIIAEAKKQKLDLDNAVYYVENYSGRKVARPQLTKLLNDSKQNDIILLEQIDRLTRLTSSKWKELKQAIDGKGLNIVACDVPTSFQVLNLNQDEMQQRILESVNSMLIEILAATASKDYEDRRRRQQEGIEANRDKFKGRKADPETANKCEKVFKAVSAEIEKLNDALKTYGVGRATYYRWRKNNKLQCPNIQM
ncbi:recombinase family protein [Psychromonas sp. L1A2]|uniref:recombinase family protein n=1 Tax=Psychromonas sp. L1A2 TaxID=2686356 RepID=UPI00135954C0|nr:recombinase family protein [Psychromonas sp. L1A2]